MWQNRGHAAQKVRKGQRRGVSTRGRSGRRHMISVRKEKQLFYAFACEKCDKVALIIVKMFISKDWETVGSDEG